MSQIKITDLPQADSLTGDELTIVVQAGVSKKASVDQVITYAESGAEQWAIVAENAANSASSQASAASVSAGQANGYAQAAATSKSGADSAAAAATSAAVDAENARDATLAQITIATNAANAASASESAAAGYASTAQTQASLASASASNADADAAAAAADRIQTQLDAAATAADRVQTGLDRVQTGLDAAATAADRVQTGLDAVTASAQASIATTKAGEAATSAGNAATSATNASNSATAAAGSAAAAAAALSTKQDTLVSGTNIKTINSQSLLGSGDIVISGGGGSSALTIDNKTAAYTVVAGDLGKIINCTSGSFIVSLTAAATLGAGFNCWIWNTSNTSTHVITIDPSGTETIDTAFTITLRCGEGCQIVCDGANWQTGSEKALCGYAENIGNNSRPTASGDGAVAIGVAAQATGLLSLGVSGLATSSYSAAIGMNSGGSRSQAVTGSGAMALGGSYASGTDSFAAAVTNNTSTYGATGTNSVAIGKRAKASSTGSIAIGSMVNSGGPISSSPSSISIGDGAQATSQNAVAVGYSAVASSYGKYAYSCGFHSTNGDAQTGTMVVRRATTDATATVLTSDGGSATTANQVILPNASAYAFTGVIVARQSAAQGTASAAWRVEGLIRREANAASTVLVNSALTVIDNTPGWTLALSADTTNGGLAVTVTGAAATNLRWVATVTTSEVTYA